MNYFPSVKKNIALSTAYQMFNLFFPFVTAPYLSRVLGADGIGIYSFTNSIATFFTMFATIGIWVYGTREIARVRDNKVELSRLFWEIEITIIAFTTASVLIWLIWIFYAPDYNIIYLILTITLFNTIADISWFFAGIEQFKYIILRNSLVKIAGIVLIFVLIKEKSDLALFVFLMASTTLIGSICMWIYIPQIIQRTDWKTIHLKKHFKESFIYFIPALATSTYTIFNKILLNILGGDIRENGYYEQATKIILMAQTLTYVALNNVMTSRLSYLFMGNKKEEIQDRIDKSLHYILFMGMGMTFGLIAISPTFIPWFFGSEFTDAIPIMQLFCPLIFISSISNCLDYHYYTPAGLKKKCAKYLVVGAIVNIISNLMLTPQLGAKGTVASFLLTESTITMLFLRNCNGYMNVSQIIRNGWKKFLAAATMLIIMFVWQKNATYLNKSFLVVTTIIAGVTTYVIVLLLLKDWFMLNITKLTSNIIRHK